MHYALGVDIGGTNTKLALVNQTGAALVSETVPTPEPKATTPQPILDGLVRAIHMFKHKVEVAGYMADGIGIAVPHYFEGQDWIQRLANSLPALEGFPLRPYLTHALGPSIALIHDLSAIGIAEHMYGKGHSYDRMLLMAIGTGISICVITEDQGLIHWNYGGEGDAGMIIVDPFGLAECSCGGHGCLEAVASGPAIRRKAFEAMNQGTATSLAEMLHQKGNLEARDVSDAACHGDAVAKDILEQAGYYIGVALTTYMHLFRPSIIVLGGGVAQACGFLLDPIRAAVRRMGSPRYLHYLQTIEIASLGPYGGAIGSAGLILHPGKYLPEDK